MKVAVVYWKHLFSPWSKGWSFRAFSGASAMAEMAAQRGRQFDPRVLDVFAKLWDEGVIEDVRRRFWGKDDIRLPRVA